MSRLGSAGRLAAAGLAAFGLICCARTPEPSADDSSQPPRHVLLVLVDTLAARHLGCYGYPRPTSPHIDALAAEGALFERAVANAPWTQPSVMALLTGIHATSHVERFEPEAGGDPLEQRRVHPDRLTLAELFRGNGFATAGFTDVHWLDPRYGTAQGFEHYDTSAAERPLSDRAGGIVHNAGAYLDWIDAETAAGDRPSFALLHAFDVHGPYLAPEPFAKRVAAVDSGYRLPDSLPAGGLAGAFHSISAYVTGTFPHPDGPPERVDPAPYLDAYDAGIAELDRELGRLVDALSDRGRLDDTLIVITADHGESIELHGRYFGHGAVSQDILHVPLILRGPGIERAARIPTPVQHLDLWPTLADLCALDAPPQPLDGRSLEPLLRGEHLDDVPLFASEGLFVQASLQLGRWRLSRYVFTGGGASSRMTFLGLDQPWIAEHLPELAGRPLTAARLASITERLGGPDRLEALLAAELPRQVLQLYDVESDPRERHDVLAEHPEVAARLNALLEAEFRAGLEARLDSPDAAAIELTPAMRSALEAVGYLEED